MMKKRLCVLVCAVACGAVWGAEMPKVWTSVSSIRTPEDFETAVKDCRAHGVDVMQCRKLKDENVCARYLEICRKYGMKLHLGAPDASKSQWLKKKTGRDPYELAVMAGGCYRGAAMDRHLYSFTAAKQSIIIEPPVYSRGQAYGKHPHYYMLGQGHYFGGYVPTGKAEVVVPEKLFDGRQHLRIIPATIEKAPADAKLEVDSAAKLKDTEEYKSRTLYRLTFDLSDCAGCRLDKVGLAVYWAMDDKDPKWRPDRTCFSVYSPLTRARMRAHVRESMEVWTRANGGTFPDDVVVAVRLGDEIFNATGWASHPMVSFPLWDYSASAQAAFKAASPEGVVCPRTWGAPEVYGTEACAQALYLFHKACAAYLKEAVDEVHGFSPKVMTFRNTTRGDAWSYANDHDGTGQELLAEVLDCIHLDPYPVSAKSYNAATIPFDMAYCTGLARRYGKPLLVWMQAHSFLENLVHPKPDQIDRMWRQMKPFEPDAIMWLGYGRDPKSAMTFPLKEPESWERAKAMHADLKAMGAPDRSRPMLAVVRPYSARAVVGETLSGFVHPSDVILREFVRVWSVTLSQPYDIFEVPPYETEAAREKRCRELARYGRVVSCVDMPGAYNVAKGLEEKVLTQNDLRKLRPGFEALARRWLEK